MKLFLKAALLFISIVKFSITDAQTLEVYMLRLKEDFESPFAVSPDGCTKLACNINVLPYIKANEAQKTSRIFAELKNPITDKSSLGMTPTSTFNPQIDIRVNVAESPIIKSAKIIFNAKSLKNGGITETKYTLLYYASSWNNGKSFSKDVLIDTFLNANGKVENYILFSNNDAIEADTLIIRITGKPSKDSSGTAAKVIIDNLYIGTTSGLLSVENSEIALSTFKIISQTHDYLTMNKPISGVLYNIMGGEVVTFNEEQKINITFLENGLYFVKSIDNQILKFKICK